jgi:ATP-dependent Clp protease ATP-binding subunit ClpA
MNSRQGTAIELIGRLHVLIPSQMWAFRCIGQRVLTSMSGLKKLSRTIRLFLFAAVQL